MPGKKRKKTGKPKGKPDPLGQQKANTKHPGLLVGAHFQAKKEGLFILVEPATGSKQEVWLVYDARSSGKHLLSFWPDNKDCSVGGERTRVHSVYQAIRIAARMVSRVCAGSQAAKANV